MEKKANIIFDAVSNNWYITDMISERIAQAIEKSSKTRYRIAVDTGIDHAVVHRIVNGGSCSLDTADKLCEYLGLELVQTKKAR